ncbi:hypothetical protein HWV62_26038 [Athelia sp. TMB]|nr:hypothetical protein HWV62_26038 [Athelia sp. TMB]
MLPYLRTILLREHVHLVHAHAALSSLGQEALLHAHMLGVRTVFTDHSLFGFEDAAAILTNKLLEAALRSVDAVVCVSHTARENTVLRGQLFDPSPDGTMVVRKNVYVIPNALVSDRFRPAETPLSSDTITIIVLSRLAYRKGIDLLIAAAPCICARWPRVKFVVGGDGPKLNELLQMREKHRLEERIELLGPLRGTDVRDVLIRGQIFLNSSLTESFGIGLLEAASCGLYVVATRVGGVPEVLPNDMVAFCAPEVDAVVKAIGEAIRRVGGMGAETNGLEDWDEGEARRPSRINEQPWDAQAAHARVKEFYSWSEVTRRTEAVYDAVMHTEAISLWERIVRTMSLGPFAGLIYTAILIVDCLFFLILEWASPREDIDYVRMGWDRKAFEAMAKRQEDRAGTLTNPSSCD